jgi:hypothetical protein
VPVGTPNTILALQSSDLFEGSPWAPSTTCTTTTGRMAWVCVQSLGGLVTAVSLGGAAGTQVTDSSTYEGDGATWQTTIWRVQVASGSGSATISVTHNEGGYELRAWVIDFTDHDTSAPIVSSSLTKAGSSGTGAQNMTVSGVPNMADTTNNLRVLVCCYGNGTSNATVSGTGWTESYDAAGTAFFTSSVITAYARANNDPTVNSADVPSHGWMGVVVEIAAPSGDTTPDVARAESGTVTPAQTLAAALASARAESGTVAPAQTAAVAVALARAEAGTLTPSGAVASVTGAVAGAQSGTLTPAGTLVGALARAGEASGTGTPAQALGVAPPIAGPSAGSVADAQTVAVAISVARAESATLEAEQDQSTDTDATTPDVANGEASTAGHAQTIVAAVAVARAESGPGLGRCGKRSARRVRDTDPGANGRGHCGWGQGRGLDR